LAAPKETAQAGVSAGGRVVRLFGRQLFCGSRTVANLRTAARDF